MRKTSTALVAPVAQEKTTHEIEKLTGNDLVALADLFRQFWGEASSLEKMRATFTTVVANPAYILLAAKQHGRLTGFAMGIVCQDLYGDCRPFMVIEDLIVDQNHRQTGVGTALLKKLEECAANQNCGQIIFVTEANRQDALQFYQSSWYPFEPYKGFKKRLTRTSPKD